jgi:hypothetical protein
VPSQEISLNRSLIPYSAAIAAGVLALASTPASAAVNDFTGAWKNANANARDVSRLEIRRESDGVAIRVWVNCHPSVCGWGTAHAQLYSPNVDVPVAGGGDTAIAEFDRGGIHRTIVLQANGGQISYNAYTRFKNGSASRHSLRNNYHTSGHMSRQ